MTLLTTSEVATRLREHPQSILRRLRAGEMRGSKVGRHWLVSEDDLQTFIDDRANFKPVETRRRRRP